MAEKRVENAKPLDPKPAAAKAPGAVMKQTRVTWRDVPRLLESLSCGDDNDRKQTLQLLCPCRNRRYDKEIWVAIFEAYRTAEGVAVRDQAGHAIGTLIERAKTDPRSQELLHWLDEQGLLTAGATDRIPTWIPNLRGNGLYIPRYEPCSRSKANRRR